MSDYQRRLEKNKCLGPEGVWHYGSDPIAIGTTWARVGPKARSPSRVKQVEAGGLVGARMPLQGRAKA